MISTSELLKMIVKGKSARVAYAAKIERMAIRELPVGESFVCVHNTPYQIGNLQRNLRKAGSFRFSYRQTTAGIKVIRKS